jgi:hypothetical protein
MVAAANAISPMIGAALTATFGLTSVFYGAATIYAIATVIVLVVVPGVMRARVEAQTQTQT